MWGDRRGQQNMWSDRRGQRTMWSCEGGPPWSKVAARARGMLLRLRRRASPVYSSLKSFPSYRRYASVDKDTARAESAKPNSFLRESGEGKGTGPVSSEDEPCNLLDHWLGELSYLGKVNPMYPKLIDLFLPRAWTVLASEVAPICWPPNLHSGLKNRKKGPGKGSRSIAAQSSTSITRMMNWTLSSKS